MWVDGAAKGTVAKMFVIRVIVTLLAISSTPAKTSRNMWFAALEPREFGSTFSLIVALLNNENE